MHHDVAIYPINYAAICVNVCMIIFCNSYSELCPQPPTLNFSSQLSTGLFISRDIWSKFITTLQSDTAGSWLQITSSDIHEPTEDSSDVESVSTVAPAVLQTDTPESLPGRGLGLHHDLIQSEKSHVDTAQLRRSTRSTRYDGFRVSQPSDNKKVVSKVKPRAVPKVHISTSATISATSLNSGQGNLGADSAVPPPTSITTIQNVGTNMCGIPPQDLSPKILLASLQEGPSLSE